MNQILLSLIYVSELNIPIYNINNDYIQHIKQEQHIIILIFISQELPSLLFFIYLFYIFDSAEYYLAIFILSFNNQQ